MVALMIGCLQGVKDGNIEEEVFIRGYSFGIINFHFLSQLFI